MMNPHGHPWFIHRQRFDLHLQQAARDAGSAWLETKARAVDIDERGVSIATADNGRISAQWVVFASARHRGRRGSLHQTPLVADSLIAFGPTCPRLYADHFAIDRGNGEWLVVFLSRRKRAPARLLYYRCGGHAGTPLLQRRCLEEIVLCDVAVAPARICEIPEISLNAIPAGISLLRRTHGDRWVAIGDAAVKLDPIGSSGVSTGSRLRAARRAGGVVRAARQQRRARPLQRLDRQPVPRLYTATQLALCGFAPNRAVLASAFAARGIKLVRTPGLEPGRDYSQGILSPLRLPFRHVRVAAHPPARGG